MELFDFMKNYHCRPADCCGNCKMFTFEDELEKLRFQPLPSDKYKARDVLLGYCKFAKEKGLSITKTGTETVCDAFISRKAAELPNQSKSEGMIWVQLGQ